jgi:hypothetical protein
MLSEMMLILDAFAVIIPIILIAYAYKKKIRNLETRALILLLSACAIWFAIDAIMQVVGSELVLLKLGYVNRAATSAFYLGLALAFSRAKILQRKWGYFLLYAPFILMSVLICVSMTGVMPRVMETFLPEFTPLGRVAYISYYSLYLLLGFSLFVREYQGSKSKIGKRRVLPVMVASVIVILYNVIGGAPVFLFGATNQPELNNIIMTTGLVLIAYAVLKYRAFIVIPMTESKKSAGPKYILKPGLSYLIKEKKSIKGFNAFVDAVKRGRQGLCITTQYPNEVRRKYSLHVTPILWLSKQRLDYSIDPASLGALAYAIDEFIRKSQKSVVMLDGLEYLVTANGFDSVVTLLHDIRESIAVNRSSFIVSVNPKTLNKAQLAIIERYMESVIMRARSENSSG